MFRCLPSIACIRVLCVSAATLKCDVCWATDIMCRFTRESYVSGIHRPVCSSSSSRSQNTSSADTVLIRNWYIYSIGNRCCRPVHMAPRVHVGRTMGMGDGPIWHIFDLRIHVWPNTMHDWKSMSFVSYFRMCNTIDRSLNFIIFFRFFCGYTLPSSTHSPTLAGVGIFLMNWVNE